MLEVFPGGVPTPLSRGGIEVGFVGSDGTQVRTGLADAAQVRFEAASPVRAFPSYKRQRYFPGSWWSSTAGRHVGYESWLERDRLIWLDFDPGVTGIASQPFWLFWRDGDKRRSHAPDYFARRADGTGVVIDCRPVNRIKPRDAEAFEATRSACQEIGWDYELVGTPDPVSTANVRWLAGYRHPRHAAAPEVVARLLEAFAEPTPLMAGACEAGEPIAVLPVLFHLMWRQQLSADLDMVLDGGSLVVAG